MNGEGKPSGIEGEGNSSSAKTTTTVRNNLTYQNPRKMTRQSINILVTEASYHSSLGTAQRLIFFLFLGCALNDL